MFVPFDSLPDNARIWIYQSPRKFTADEKDLINASLRQVTDTWEAHGEPLKSSFSIPYDQFIIIAADEDFHKPSGCSIDACVNALKALAAQLSIDLFDRQQVGFKRNDILIIPTKELKEKYAAGIWSKDSLTFNNVVQAKADLQTRWIVPASETWLKRYLSQETSVHGAEKIL